MIKELLEKIREPVIIIGAFADRHLPERFCVFILRG
jgi:hypothetical protein